MTDPKLTPPPELVQQWVAEIWHEGTPVRVALSDEHIATRAAQWGADQELLACGNYLKQCAAWEEEHVTEIYNYRRPRPLSLKELALESVKRFEKSGEFFSDQMRELEFIRKALEALPE
jgi:ferritin